MRTLLIIIAGLALLGIFLLASTKIGEVGTLVGAAKLFIPFWLAVALINMWIGVTRAGYSVAEEFPIFLLIFAIPTAAALLVWWKFS